jgi:hypothetical protein
MFRGKLLVLLLAGLLLLAACGGGPAEEGGPPSTSVAPAAVPQRPPQACSAVPDPLPPGPPGALIRAVPIAGVPVLPDSRAWAVLYHSRDFDGRDVAVSGWWWPRRERPQRTAGRWWCGATGRSAWPTSAHPPTQGCLAPSAPGLAGCSSRTWWWRPPTTRGWARPGWSAL